MSHTGSARGGWTVLGRGSGREAHSESNLSVVRVLPLASRHSAVIRKAAQNQTMPLFGNNALPFVWRGMWATSAT